jgi:hypothetical protein
LSYLEFEREPVLLVETSKIYVCVFDLRRMIEIYGLQHSSQNNSEVDMKISLRESLIGSDGLHTAIDK